MALCDGGAQYSLEAMVKNAPHVEVEAFLQTHNVAVDSIPTPYTYLHVNTGEHQILLDMGAGNLLPTTGRLLQNLKKAGLSPESIDTIFISHAHPDHVGGAIDDRGEPVFSNATYFIWEREWHFWFSEEAPLLASESFIAFARQKLTPLKEKTILVEQEGEIVPGVGVLFAPGHTPGHMIVFVRSGDTLLLYTADTVLHPLHLERPDWIPIFDILPAQAERSKHHIFDLAAVTKSLVLGQHFPPFPNLGYIIKQEFGWKWQPV